VSNKNLYPATPDQGLFEATQEADATEKSGIRLKLLFSIPEFLNSQFANSG
jgi:hypothetical protein